MKLLLSLAVAAALILTPAAAEAKPSKKLPCIGSVSTVEYRAHKKPIRTASVCAYIISRRFLG